MRDGVNHFCSSLFRLVVLCMMAGIIIHMFLALNRERVEHARQHEAAQRERAEIRRAIEHQRDLIDVSRQEIIDRFAALRNHASTTADEPEVETWAP